MMRYRLRWVAIGALLATVLLSSGALIHSVVAARQVSPDNTKSNRTVTPTAEKQPNTPSDMDITRRIRQALAKEKTLSTYAHNVKIVTQSGTVTLAGPVRSLKEKEFIVTKAAEVAGQPNVVDKMDIVPKHSSALDNAFENLNSSQGE